MDLFARFRPASGSGAPTPTMRRVSARPLLAALCAVQRVLLSACSLRPSAHTCSAAPVVGSRGARLLPGP